MSRRPALEAAPLAGHQLPPVGVSHAQRLMALRSYIPQVAQTGVATRGMKAAEELAAFRALVDQYKPSEEMCKNAYAATRYMKQIADTNPNIDEFLFWGWGGTPNNFFTTVNHMSSNENFIIEWVGVLAPGLLEGRQKNTLTTTEKHSFNAMMAVIHFQMAMKKLKENVPNWEKDDRYGEFSPW